MFSTIELPHLSLHTQQQAAKALSRWQALRRDCYWWFNKLYKPHLFNDAILSLNGLDGATLFYCVMQYKDYYWQRHQSIRYVHPLGVSSVLECKQGLIVGRRSGHTTQHRGEWELVASGGITPSCINNNTLDYLSQLNKELNEELGFDLEDCFHIKPLFLITDHQEQVSDIVVYLQTNRSFDEIQRHFIQNSRDEYDDIACIAPSEINDFIAKQPCCRVSQEILSRYHRDHFTSG